MQHDETTDAFRTRQRINQYIDWAAKAALVAILTFVWKMYTQQQELITQQALTDAKIAQIADNTNIRITQLEKDIAEIKGSMVTIDTLKRVELYMDKLFEYLGIRKRIDLTSDDLKK